MNYYGLDISSIFIDPHDTTGKTVYVTVAGIPSLTEEVQTVYGSTDGGAHWTALTANLPAAPANSLVVDPQDANTVYVATDAGVYSTRQIANCASASSGCWSAFGSGLPEAPVVALSAAPATASVQDLVAATYGRGIWINPLWERPGGGTGPATDTLSATSLTFPRHGRRAALGRADRDADQQRRRAADFHCHLGERSHSSRRMTAPPTWRQTPVARSACNSIPPRRAARPARSSFRRYALRSRRRWL